MKVLRSVNWITIGLGVTLIVLSVVVKIFQPFQAIMEQQMRMEPGTYFYNFWKTPPVDVYNKFYFFNYTNTERYMAGVDSKLKLQEVGPFTFKEITENKNVTFNANHTISFIPKKTNVYLPEKSFADINTLVLTYPNVFLLAASSYLAKRSSIASFGFAALATTYKAKPFLNLTVKDIFYGYDDDLTKLSSKFVPHLVSERISIPQELFDADNNNLLTILLPEGVKELKKVQPYVDEERELGGDEVTSLEDESTETLDVEYVDSDEQVKVTSSSSELHKPFRLRDYSISVLNGSPFLPHWNEDNSRDQNPSANGCNVVRGDSDGCLLPKDLSKNETIKFYRKSLCQHYFGDFEREEQFNGVDAYWYRIRDVEDSLDNPHTRCFCDKDVTSKNRCYKRGLGNIGKCYRDIPLTGSFPHFYSHNPNHSDPTLFDHFEGLHPDEAKHKSVVVVQPKLGITLSFKVRVQLNLMIGDIKLTTEARKLSNMPLPLCWLEIDYDEAPLQARILLKLYFLLPIIEDCFAIFIAFCGITCILYSLVKVQIKKAKFQEESLRSIPETKVLLR